MKTLIVFSVSLLLSFSGGCQQLVKNIDNDLDLFHLGDSIQIFRNQLSCADKALKDSTFNLDSILSCKGFKFLPAEKTPIQIRKVKFPTIFLFPNDQKKIVVLDFLKNYLQTDSTEPKATSSKEYNLLVTYFDSSLKKKSKKTDIFENTYVSQQGRVWLKDNVKYVLVKTKFKRKPGILRYGLDLSYTLIE